MTHERRETCAVKHLSSIADVRRYHAVRDFCCIALRQQSVCFILFILFFVRVVTFVIVAVALRLDSFRMLLSLVSSYRELPYLAWRGPRKETSAIT